MEIFAIFVIYGGKKKLEEAEIAKLDGWCMGWYTIN